MKVVPVRVSGGRLDEKTRSAFKNSSRRATTAPFGEESLSQRASNEDELDLRVSIGNELRDEFPVACVVETEALVGRQSDAVSVKGSESKGLVRASPRVGHVERNINVSPVLMRSVTGYRSPLFGGKLSDGELGTRDASSNAVSRALKKLHKLPGAIEAAISPRFWQESKMRRCA